MPVMLPPLVIRPEALEEAVGAAPRPVAKRLPGRIGGPTAAAMVALALTPLVHVATLWWTWPLVGVYGALLWRYRALRARALAAGQVVWGERVPGGRLANDRLRFDADGEVRELPYVAPGVVVMDADGRLAALVSPSGADPLSVLDAETLTKQLGVSWGALVSALDQEAMGEDALVHLWRYLAATQPFDVLGPVARLLGAHPSDRVAGAALEALTWRPGPDSVEVLLAGLKRSDAGVVVAACKALARLGAEQARAPIAALASDPRPEVAAGARAALARLDQAAAEGGRGGLSLGAEATGELSPVGDDGGLSDAEP